MRKKRIFARAFFFLGFFLVECMQQCDETHGKVQFVFRLPLVFSHMICVACILLGCLVVKIWVTTLMCDDSKTRMVGLSRVPKGTRS